VQKEDFYQKLRSRVKEWAAEEGKESKTLKYVLMAPDFFHLLCKLMFDPRIPAVEKAKIGGAIAYFISPIDVVPEGLVGPEVLQEHWAGDGDVLKNIQDTLRVVDELIGSGMWKKIKRLLK